MTVIKNNESVRTSIRFGYRFAQIVIQLFLKVFYRLSVKGLENIPAKDGVINDSNHAAYIDPPAIGSVIPREISYFAKKEHFSIPFVREFITYTNSIPVDWKSFQGKTVLIKNDYTLSSFVSSIRN